MQTGDFATQFLSFTLSQNGYQKNNHDYLRFPIRGLKNRLAFEFRNFLLDLADRFGFVYAKNNKIEARINYLNFIGENIDETKEKYMPSSLWKKILLRCGAISS